MSEGGEVFFPVGEYENVVWDRGGRGGVVFGFISTLKLRKKIITIKKKLSRLIYLGIPVIIFSNVIIVFFL